MEKHDLADIQGLAVFGYNLPFLHFLFFRIDTRDGGRQWLSHVIREVTTAGTGEKQPHSLNVGFTYRGLEAFGLGDEHLAPLDPEFRAGIESRAEVLGDTGESHHGNWHGGLGTPHMHGVLMLFDDVAGELKDRHEHHVALMAASGVSCLSEQTGAALPGRKEHFGYRDGISRVTLKGTGTPRPGSRAVNPGEFVLGHVDEDGLVSGGGHPFAKNGTYLVYRKLYQDVATWRALLGKASDDLGINEDEVAAKIMGRWPSGAPLMLAPKEDDPSLADDSNFSYAADADGYVCPFGAHSRRANPRDDFGPMDTRHLLMRRGLPYGTPLPEGATTDPDPDRGVVGVFVNARISRQFEHVQQVWLNDPKLRGRTTTDKDVIAGDHDGTHTFTIQDPLFARQIPDITRVTKVKGGAYLFAPSMQSLRALAGIAHQTPLSKEEFPMSDQSSTATAEATVPSPAPVPSPEPQPAAPAAPSPQAPAAAATEATSAGTTPMAEAAPVKDVHTYLTTIATIKEGSLERLKAVLAAVKEDRKRERPLTKIGTVHFARWAIIDDGTRLLFTSNFDGDLDKYLDDFIREASDALDAVWSNCVGYPEGGAKDVPAFKQFVTDMSIPNAVEYTAYPDAFVREVLSALNARRKFTEFLREFRTM